MRDNMSLLLRVFGRWVGSADIDFLAKRLNDINLDDLETSSDILQRDVVDRIQLSSLDLILNLFDEMERGKYPGLINNFFASNLVALLAPTDQAAFAKHLREMIQMKFVRIRYDNAESSPIDK